MDALRDRRVLEEMAVNGDTPWLNTTVPVARDTTVPVALAAS
jgi:hypothetical protein